MVQQRNDLIKHSDRAILAKEPMFCFETAIKLLYWCTLAYEYDEVISIVTMLQSCSVTAGMRLQTGCCFGMTSSL